MSKVNNKAPLLENTKVIVNYNYEYVHKSKSIRIHKGEVFQLLQQTNEHWWKCLRAGQSKSFYVPATYVTLVDRNNIRQHPNSDSNASTDEDLDNEDEKDEELEEGEEEEEDDGEDNNCRRTKNCDNNLCSSDNKSSSKFKTEIVIEHDNQSLSSIPSNVVTFSSEHLAAGGDDGGGGGGRGSSIRGSTNSVASSSSKKHHKASSCGSISNLKKDIPWSNSLEELAKQIVFPGQSTIYFNNPTFKPDASSNKSDTASLHQRTPPPCSLSLSSDLDLELNSSNDGNLSGGGGGRLIGQGGGGGGCGSSSTGGLTEDEEMMNHENNNNPPRKEDLVRVLSSSWSEFKCRNSDRVFYYNSATKSRSWKPPRLSKEESNNNVFQIPPGWTQTLDEQNGTVSFINQATGSKWFSSADPQGKVYFYEENSSKSSWFLPVSDNNAGSTSAGRPTSCMPGHTPLHDSISSSGDSSEIDDLTKVYKRHSTGDYGILDRNFKSQSICVVDARQHNLESKSKVDSLPRHLTIWKNGKLPVLYENVLNRTKIMENNKKVRKNWGTSWAVLTHTHLSFFKDQKSFNHSQNIKSEFEVDLHFSRIDMTSDRSSRKYVFQLTNSNIELLCQSNNQKESEHWFDQIHQVLRNLQQDEELVKYKGNTLDFLSTHSSDSTVKRKGTMKSNKVNITSAEDADRNMIRSQLINFLFRRPHKDALVKKGIYKDEPVFGCLLEKLTATDKSPIPLFVDECIRVIESNEENLKTDGIYRASGNLSQVQKIRLQVDQNNLLVLYSEEDVHVLAGALKLFFREMREPILPSSLFDRFLKACQLRNEEKLVEFKKLINALPKPNYSTLKRLLSHLLKVASYSEFNRMQIPNLAIVFGPTLMWSATESPNMAIDLMQQNYVVEILLQDFDNFFP